MTKDQAIALMNKVATSAMIRGQYVQNNNSLNVSYDQLPFKAIHEVFECQSDYMKAINIQFNNPLSKEEEKVVFDLCQKYKVDMKG